VLKSWCWAYDPLCQVTTAHVDAVANPNQHRFPCLLQLSPFVFKLKDFILFLYFELKLGIRIALGIIRSFTLFRLIKQ
jgi:hypothetical protein